MRLLLATLTALGSVLAVAGGCTKAPAQQQTLCTPGDNVFCRCAGGAAGTKLCLPDGQGFGPCEHANGSCEYPVGGNGGSGGSGASGAWGGFGAWGGLGGVGGMPGGYGGTTTGGSGGAPICHVVVNEVQTGSSASASDEFVELYNPCLDSFDLTGWKLVYRSASGTSDFTLLQWSSGTIFGTSYLLIVGSGWTGGWSDATFANGGLSATAGGVGLRNSLSALVDSVGYGSATNEFVEGVPAPAPSVGASIGRSPNGVDTNDNAFDFVQFDLPTPGTSNGY